MRRSIFAVAVLALCVAGTALALPGKRDLGVHATDNAARDYARVRCWDSNDCAADGDPNDGAFYWNSTTAECRRWDASIAGDWIDCDANSSHVQGDGSDHADVATATAWIAEGVQYSDLTDGYLATRSGAGWTGTDPSTLGGGDACYVVDFTGATHDWTTDGATDPITGFTASGDYTLFDTFERSSSGIRIVESSAGGNWGTFLKLKLNDQFVGTIPGWIARVRYTIPAGGLTGNWDKLSLRINDGTGTNDEIQGTVESNGGAINVIGAHIRRGVNSNNNTAIGALPHTDYDMWLKFSGEQARIWIDKGGTGFTDPTRPTAGDWGRASTGDTYMDLYFEAWSGHAIDITITELEFCAAASF